MGPGKGLHVVDDDVRFDSFMKHGGTCKGKYAPYYPEDMTML